MVLTRALHQVGKIEERERHQLTPGEELGSPDDRRGAQ